uniref:Protein krueppel n=1 Tax=Stomoxys calcitrans TaxID=35570 RepID=A0A1I8QBA2_STOCA
MLRYPPSSDYCRLCVKSCNNYQHSLYDETGQANSNHDMVVKYFTSAMLNMEWEQRLQYICEKCWQHIWEFHQFQESIIEAQQGPHLHTEAAKEVAEQETQLVLPSAKALSTSAEGFIKTTDLSFHIKTEEPLDLNSDCEGMSSQSLDQLRDEEVSLTNAALTNDVESNPDFSSNDDMPLSSLSHINLSFSESKCAATKRSVEEFDELVALWRSSLECEICHQLMASYSQLKDHFSKNHTSEICYLMCCQLRLDNRYDLEKHIRYHSAPQQLKCDACCKAFRLVRLLRDHKRKVHTSKGGDKNAKASEKLEVGKYRCCTCLKEFASKTHLYTHNRDVHKTKIFECDICEKSFTRSATLRQHLASHKGEKTHGCSFCPQAFTSRAYCRRHMRTNHSEEWKKMQNESAQKKGEFRQEIRGEYDGSVAKQASGISESPAPSEQQSRYTRIIEPKTTDVSNITPDGDNFNELGKEEEDSMMATMEARELKDENATRANVKTGPFSANTNVLRNGQMYENEMPLEEFIKSEEEFIDL